MILTGDTIFITDAQEVLVERAKPLRNDPGPNDGTLVTQFNDSMLHHQS
jgi:hypothetical protein